MNKPYHFIGYWGLISQTEQEKFNNIIKNISTTSYKFQKQETWGILYLGVKQIPSSTNINQGLIASLSAGGIPNQSDAWVTVEKNCLSLGRETFGRVPLYWTQFNQTIWFASQFQLLLPLIKNPKINFLSLSGYTSFSYIPTPITPVEDIKAISPGTEQTWQLNSSLEQLAEKRLFQWHSLPKVIGDEETAIRQLQILLKKTVEEQLLDLGDEPVGIFLSGGLDSSIIAALLVQAGLKVRAYSLDFGIEENSELIYAQEVAQFLKIPLIKVPATAKQVKKALLATVKALDLPFGDGVTVPLYLLGQAASQETAIIFNGEHGDQLFAGWTNKPLIAASIYQGENSFTQEYLNTFHRLYGYEEQVFQLSVYKQVKLYNLDEWLKEALCESFSSCFLDRLRRANLMLKGSQNIQPRATNVAFAHGLWIRSPFCNLSLAEWTFGVAGELFLKGACEKYILKKAVESWLPSEIVWRKKRGMGVPLTQWCLSSLWSTLGYWLNPHKLQSEGIFNPDIAKKIILGQLSGQIRGRRIGEILWLLLMWEVWRTEVFREQVSAKSLYNPFWLPYRGWKILSSLSGDK
ncbi:asparagine synthetase B family protein [Gloeothece verrucosa]|nr:asparagine synthetase B family protein [Gloeothece verrucosa]